MELTDKELDELIAGLTLTDDKPRREIIVLALIELRDLRKRWRAFEWSFPIISKWMVWLSRKRYAGS